MEIDEVIIDGEKLNIKDLSFDFDAAWVKEPQRTPFEMEHNLVKAREIFISLEGLIYIADKFGYELIKKEQNNDTNNGQN